MRLMVRCIVAVACLAMALVAPHKAGAQAVLHGYEFSTGVDSSLWYSMGVPSNPQNIVGNTYFPLPFPFAMVDVDYNGVYVSPDGTMTFVSHPDSLSSPSQYFPLDTQMMDHKNKYLFAYRNALQAGYVQTTVVNPDSVGKRVMVFQLRAGVRSETGYTRIWQVHLHEEDYSITFVYGQVTDSMLMVAGIGMMMGNGHMLHVNQRNHTATSSRNVLNNTSWPGQYRYYHFVPSGTYCPPPIGLFAAGDLVGGNIRLYWRRCSLVNSYVVEYGLEGFASGSGTRLVVSDTTLVLTDLVADEDYEVRVSPICTDAGSGYASLHFHTSCYLLNGNAVNYADLHSPDVLCTTGTFSSPSGPGSPSNIQDYGSESYLSRHTVHTDTSERDIFTGSVLRTVPEGFCASVRLGNWMAGAGQESIVYTLTVDTGMFDLLILRYALVEQNPNHGETENPRFEFEIMDLDGSRISNCYYGNFVSGDLSGWNQSSNFQGVLWRDWEAVGVDLAPLHGRTIRVALSNYDCALGGHFGYAYFTLQSALKHIAAESCGNEAENTFVAPDGFSYRWYSAADSSTTLSTDRSLYVAAAGEYNCYVSYRLSGQVCGFTMSTYAGGRFPHAAFAVERLDSCGSFCRFVNQSVIARDEACTQLTEFPCDEYLWVFDDSTTSAETNTTHRFGEGTHTVKLYAMLAGGACVDSVSYTFTVHLDYDTVYDTICATDFYDFHGELLSSSGVYTYTVECEVSVLFLEVMPVYDSTVYVLLQMGESFRFAGRVYSRPGVYDVHLTSVAGCDSSFVLHIGCVDVRDSVVCSSLLPVVWDGVEFAGEGSDTLFYTSVAGTDSIVVLRLHVLQPPHLGVEPEIRCGLPGGYWLPMDGSLCYRWSSVPVDTLLPSGTLNGGDLDGGILLQPRDSTLYCLTADYCDGVSCPASDTLWLGPVYPVEAALQVSPAVVTADSPTATAMDMTLQPHARDWFVNGLQLSDTSQVVYYHTTVSDDSVRVVLVATTLTCADTVCASVPVRMQTLWFPNVFTPGEASNNVFRGYGLNVRDYELRVYTRWGDCIFHTTDIDEGWNGTYLGVQSPVSAYLYVCRYTDLDGEPRIVSGTVALLR